MVRVTTIAAARRRRRLLNDSKIVVHDSIAVKGRFKVVVEVQDGEIE